MEDFLNKKQETQKENDKVMDRRLLIKPIIGNGTPDSTDEVGRNLNTKAGLRGASFSFIEKSKANGIKKQNSIQPHRYGLNTRNSLRSNRESPLFARGTEDYEYYDEVENGDSFGKRHEQLGKSR